MKQHEDLVRHIAFLIKSDAFGSHVTTNDWTAPHNQRWIEAAKRVIRVVLDHLNDQEIVTALQRARRAEDAIVQVSQLLLNGLEPLVECGRILEEVLRKRVGESEKPTP